MSAKSERPRNRTVKLVGGGTRRLRGGGGANKGGSIKSMRRAIRQQIKDKRSLTPEARRALKHQLTELLKRKDGRQ